MRPEVRIRGVAGPAGTDAPFIRPFVRPFVDAEPFSAAGAEVEVGRVDVDVPLSLGPVVVGPAR